MQNHQRDHNAMFHPSLNPPRGERIADLDPRVTDAQKLALALVIATLIAVLCGCGTVKVSGQRQVSPTPAAKPATIYVADFDLDATRIKSDAPLIPAPPKLPGFLGRTLPALPGTPKDPQRLAHDLVESMSASLVRDLAQAGLPARRLTRGGPLPTNGWLVRGVFTEVNQGNQLRRAVIGFGAGKSDLQAVVEITDLSQGAPKPFYELSATADSGKAPGAGPMIAMSPAGAAARFVIAGQDLDRSVKGTASKIAIEVVLRTRPAPASQAAL